MTRSMPARDSTELGKLSLTNSSIKPYTITETLEVEVRLIFIRGKI